jgi:ribonuclease HI
MRLDEFVSSLALLPDNLSARVDAMRSCAITRPECGACQATCDALELVFAAARYDQLAYTHQLVGHAERLSSDPRHQHAAADACAHPAYRIPPAGLHSQVHRWANTDQRLVAATDASWKHRAAGLGFVVSDGRWGLRNRRSCRPDPTGPHATLVNELRAVEFLLATINTDTRPLTVLVDSTDALRFLYLWQGGTAITVMPFGYSLRPRSHVPQPSLVALAHRVADEPGLTFEHVKGHRGHFLNEAADSLAKMARRNLRERFDVATRASDLVDSFLLDWHTANPS